MDAVTSDFAAEMRALHRASESRVLAPLLVRAAPSAPERERIVARASGMLADLRAAQSSGWVNQFLQEYRLNTSEGVALLSLAEAFLRVPDPDTADATGVPTRENRHRAWSTSAPGAWSSGARWSARRKRQGCSAA
jgi:RHH-type proline utilization regulon transcriptional repressor/proline dehydrogenase/delta 1-pyrroline-5-carboxylate dehydrogenase